MNIEDSRNALYCDPNAFIQKQSNKKQEHKKIIYQEPYESMPAFYIDNNFKKGNCECVPQKKEKNIKHEESKCECISKQNKSLGFDLKNFLPLLGMFNKGGGADLSQIMSLLNNNLQNSNNSNPINMISSLLSNGGGLGNILKIFKGGQKSKLAKKELHTTDFEIKNYTRVE